MSEDNMGTNVDAADYGSGAGFGPSGDYAAVNASSGMQSSFGDFAYSAGVTLGMGIAASRGGWGGLGGMVAGGLTAAASNPQAFGNVSQDVVNAFGQAYDASLGAIGLSAIEAGFAAYGFDSHSYDVIGFSMDGGGSYTVYAVPAQSWSAGSET